MKPQSNLPVLLLASLAQARNLQRQSLQWTNDCPGVSVNSTLQYGCSDLQVPLDYDEPNKAAINLQLVRVPAPEQPSKGSILFNFGGPGGEARNAMLAYGAHMQA